MARVAQLLDEADLKLDYVDLNCGCPIDLIVNKGAGSALLLKPTRLAAGIRALDTCLECPVTVKLRKGYYDKQVLYCCCPVPSTGGHRAMGSGCVCASNAQ